MTKIDQTISWLRELAAKGGKGVVNNIDARCLGRVADELERLSRHAQRALDTTHYLNAIRVRLETLYASAADDPRLREQLSDEVDWIDAQLSLSVPSTDGGGE